MTASIYSLKLQLALCLSVLATPAHLPVMAGDILPDNSSRDYISKPGKRIPAVAGVPVIDGVISPSEWGYGGSSDFTRKRSVGIGKPRIVVEPGTVYFMNDHEYLYVRVSQPQTEAGSGGHARVITSYSNKTPNSKLLGAELGVGLADVVDGPLFETEGVRSAAGQADGWLHYEYAIPMHIVVRGGVIDPGIQIKVDERHSTAGDGGGLVVSGGHKLRAILANPETLTISHPYLQIPPTEPVGFSYLEPDVSVSIDGISQPGEWDGSHDIEYEVALENGAAKSTVFVLNDSDLLYVRIQTPVPDSNTPVYSSIWIDGNNDGSQQWVAPDYRTDTTYNANGELSVWPPNPSVISESKLSDGLLTTEISIPLPPATKADGADIRIHASTAIGQSRGGIWLESVPPSGPIEVLRTMSYNVGTYGKLQGPYGERLDIIADDIVNGGIHIAAIQELDRKVHGTDGTVLLARKLEERGYPMYWAYADRANDNVVDYGQSIFSRYPIESDQTIYLHDYLDDRDANHLEERNFAFQEAKIRLPGGGEPITVINQHPRPGGYACFTNWRLRQLVGGDLSYKEIATYDKNGGRSDYSNSHSGTTFVMGDFNQSNSFGGGCRPRLWETQLGFTNACAAHQVDEALCESVTLELENPKQIDFIMHRSVDERLELLEAWRARPPSTSTTYPQGISDHLPIYATYRVLGD